MYNDLEEMNIEEILGDDAFVDNDSTNVHTLEDSSSRIESLGEDIPNRISSTMEGIDLGSGLEDEVVYPSRMPSPIVNDPAVLTNVGIPIGSPVQQSLEDPTLDDILLESIRDGDPVSTILNHVLMEIAEEVCYLKAYRNSGWDAETDFSDISAKRIRSLKSLVESLVEKEKLKNSKDTGKVDFHSKNFENVFVHFLEVIKETFEKVKIPSQYTSIFFAQLGKDLDGFEKEAEKIYYGKKK